MEISVRKSDGVVIQYGQNLGEREDCDVVALSAAEEADVRAHMAKGRSVTYAHGAFDLVIAAEDTVAAEDAVE